MLCAVALCTHYSPSTAGFPELSLELLKFEAEKANNGVAFLSPTHAIFFFVQFKCFLHQHHICTVMNETLKNTNNSNYATGQ